MKAAAGASRSCNRTPESAESSRWPIQELEDRRSAFHSLQKAKVLLVKASEKPQLSEFVACLALATDLGMGQPLEHCLRTCLLTVRMGEHLGLAVQQLADAYYIALLRFVGCNSHAHQDFIETGDEVAFRAGVAPVLNGGMSGMLRFTVTRLGSGSAKAARAKMVAGALAAGSKGARETIAATCEVAQMSAGRLGLSEPIVQGLAYSYERYDGKGFPAGAEGERFRWPPTSPCWPGISRYCTAWGVGAW